MNNKQIGNTGLMVSEMALGTMTFGQKWGEWGCDKNVSAEIFKHYADNGGNCFDCANIYHNGESEVFLGEFIHGSRDKYIVMTKYTAQVDPANINSKGNHRKSLKMAVEQSLKNLQTDYIDIMWVHAWDLITPAEEMLYSLNDLIHQGKVLYIGVSNMPAWMIAKANTLAKAHGLSGFTANQMEYNLIDRSGEAEFSGLLEEFKMSNFIWSPLASGLLTGKYNQQNKEKTRIDYTKFVEINDRALSIASEVSALAKELDLNPAELALRWIMQKSERNIPILGARSVSQLSANMRAADCKLDETVMEKLNKLSKPLPVYPYSRINP